MSTPPTSAYTALADHRFRASELTRGPWDPAHQHAVQLFLAPLSPIARRDDPNVMPAAEESRRQGREE